MEKKPGPPVAVIPLRVVLNRFNHVVERLSHLGTRSFSVEDRRSLLRELSHRSLPPDCGVVQFSHGLRSGHIVSSIRTLTMAGSTTDRLAKLECEELPAAKDVSTEMSSQPGRALWFAKTRDAAGVCCTGWLAT